MQVELAFTSGHHSQNKNYSCCVRHLYYAHEKRIIWRIKFKPMEGKGSRLYRDER